MQMPAAASPWATSIGGFCELSVKYRALAATSCRIRSPAIQPSQTARVSRFVGSGSLTASAANRRWICCWITIS